MSEISLDRPLTEVDQPVPGGDAFVNPDTSEERVDTSPADVQGELAAEEEGTVPYAQAYVNEPEVATDEPTLVIRSMATTLVGGRMQVPEKVTTTREELTEDPSKTMAVSAADNAAIIEDSRAEDQHIPQPVQKQIQPAQSEETSAPPETEHGQGDDDGGSEPPDYPVPSDESDDDAVDADWFGCGSIEELKEATRQRDEEQGVPVQPLYASHDYIINRALDWL